ncbi:unnamed protein product [Urochloa humidicola]
MSSAASSTKRPGTRTASVCAIAEAARATHSFRVSGGVLHRGFGVGSCVRSAAFSAGGHRWCIKYFPDGDTANTSTDPYVSIYLEFLSKNAEATAIYDIWLVNQATGLSTSVLKHQATFKDKATVWGRPKILKSELEANGYLKDDCLEIECDIAVIKVEDIDVPPSDALSHLSKLLDDKDGMDVTFKVKEEFIHAHRIVLAMRSPVFKAELYGPLRDKRKRSIAVDDMEPRVFKGLLHFIYTDSLPTMDDLDGDEYEEMMKHLLVAADRYGMERMKLMCENILCGRFSVERVANTLVLADQHHCDKLRDACIRFIDGSNRMDDVAASQGYENLKRACPALTADLWEKSAKVRKL